MQNFEIKKQNKSRHLKKVDIFPIVYMSLFCEGVDMLTPVTISRKSVSSFHSIGTYCLFPWYRPTSHHRPD